SLQQSLFEWPIGAAMACVAGVTGEGGVHSGGEYGRVRVVAGHAPPGVSLVVQQVGAGGGPGRIGKSDGEYDGCARVGELRGRHAKVVAVGTGPARRGERLGQFGEE